MKRFIVLMGVILGFIMIGVLVWQSDNSKQNTFLKSHNLEGLSIQEIVDYLERKTDEPAGFKASITGTKLTLGDEFSSFDLAVPKGLFYLSFAPYVDQTHPCGNHNLVTCTGELKSTVFQVTITDQTTGLTVYDGNLKSSAKGFIGIWLPRGKTLRITVRYGDLSATSIVTTNYDSDTCLTTLRLN